MAYLATDINPSPTIVGKLDKDYVDLRGRAVKFDANGIQSALYSANKVLLKNGIHDCEIRLDYDGGYFIVQRMENGDEASSEDETSWNVASRVAEFLGGDFNWK